MKRKQYGLDAAPQLSIPQLTGRRRATIGCMQFLEAVAAAFFRTFGITEPTAKTRRRAAQFIFVLFTVILLSFIAAAAILFHMV
jgi:hypothetical protein